MISQISSQNKLGNYLPSSRNKQPSAVCTAYSSLTSRKFKHRCTDTHLLNDFEKRKYKMYTRRNGNRAICRVHASSIEEFYATLNDSITIDGTARSFVPIPRVKAPRMASVAIKMDENVTQGYKIAWRGSWAAIKNFDRLEKLKKKKKKRKLTRDFFAFHGWKFFNEKLGEILDVDL